MKRIVTILAASAVLAAGLAAGLAAPGAGGAGVAAAATPAWVEPPSRAGTDCRDAAWPYRAALCDRAASGSPRKVRVIAALAPSSDAPRR